MCSTLLLHYSTRPRVYHFSPLCKLPRQRMCEVAYGQGKSDTPLSAITNLYDSALPISRS
jgi:hypothetical protein